MGKWGYIDQQGEVAIAPQFDYAADFSEGLAAVQQDGRYGYIDTDGKLGGGTHLHQRRTLLRRIRPRANGESMGLY